MFFVATASVKKVPAAMIAAAAFLANASKIPVGNLAGILVCPFVVIK